MGCVLVLTAVVLTATGAVPFPKPLGVLADAQGCHLAQFQSLSPQELQAFKRAKDTFVSLPLPHLLGARLYLCLSGLPCCTPPNGDLPPSLTRLTSPNPAVGRLLSSCGGGASITFCTLTWAPVLLGWASPLCPSCWGLTSACPLQEESLSQKAWSCRPRLFPRTWDLQQLKVRA